MKSPLWVYIERVALVVFGVMLVVVVLLAQRAFAGPLTITLVHDRLTTQACYTTGALKYYVGSGVIENEVNCDITFIGGFE